MLANGIEFFVRTIFLFLGLLIMMLLQKQDWRFLPLAGIAALGGRSGGVTKIIVRLPVAWLR